MAQIVTTKNGTTNEIQYPRTVKSALLNDDGTPLNPLTQTNIVNDLTTGGETNVLSAQQGVAINSAIGQLQDDIGNIDVSWDAITGKPTTFAPSTHDHDIRYLIKDTDGSAIYLSGVDLNSTITTGLYRGTGCSNQPPLTHGWFYMIVIGHGSAWVYQECIDLHDSSKRYIRHMHSGEWTAWTDPFGIVVSGKQEVVNAINGTIGYSSGLTTSNTHADMAWWIQNKVLTSSEKLKKLYNQITSCTTVLSMSYTALPYTSISGSSWYRTLEPGLYFMQDVSWRGSSGYPIKLIAPTVTVYINESNSTTITDLPVICKGLADKVTHTYRLILITETTQLRGYDPNSTRIYDGEKVWYKLNI